MQANKKEQHILFILGGALALWSVWQLWKILETKKSGAFSDVRDRQSNRALKLWELMEPYKEYTQRELSEISGIPYRSVRRYIDKLSALGKVKVVGKARATKILKII